MVINISVCKNAGKYSLLQRKTDLRGAYLDPVWFHSIEVLTMRTYNFGIARK